MSSNGVETISKYFAKMPDQHNQYKPGTSSVNHADGLGATCIIESPYKNSVTALHPILNNSLTDANDFKSPEQVKRSRKVFQTRLRNKLVKNVNKTKSKVKKSNKKCNTAQNSIARMIHDNFKASDVNGEHLQMAIALSKSIQSKDSLNTSEVEVDFSSVCTPTQIKFATVKQTLEQFGFRSKKPIIDGQNKTGEVFKKKKKSRYQYITPVLFLRTPEDRVKLISAKVSLILSQNRDNHVECSKSDLILSSSYLQKFHAVEGNVFNLSQLDSDTVNDKDLFYVKSLNIPPSTSVCGSLLKKWEDIPGREPTPPLLVEPQFINECGRLSTGNLELRSSVNVNSIDMFKKIEMISSPERSESINRCESPDLFDSDEDDLKINFLNKSVDEQLRFHGSFKLTSPCKTTSRTRNKAMLPITESISSGASIEYSSTDNQMELSNESSQSSKISKNVAAVNVSKSSSDLSDCEVYKSKSGIYHFESFCEDGNKHRDYYDDVMHFSGEEHDLLDAYSLRLSCQNSCNAMKTTLSNQFHGNESCMSNELCSKRFETSKECITTQVPNVGGGPEFSHFSNKHFEVVDLTQSSDESEVDGYSEHISLNSNENDTEKPVNKDFTEKLESFFYDGEDVGNNLCMQQRVSESSNSHCFSEENCVNDGNKNINSVNVASIKYNLLETLLNLGISNPCSSKVSVSADGNKNGEEVDSSETWKKSVSFASSTSEDNCSQETICISDEELNYSSIYSTPQKQKYKLNTSKLEDDSKYDNHGKVGVSKINENDSFKGEINNDLDLDALTTNEKTINNQQYWHEHVDYDFYYDNYTTNEGNALSAITLPNFTVQHPRVKNLKQESPQTNSLRQATASYVLGDSFDSMFESTNELQPPATSNKDKIANVLVTPKSNDKSNYKCVTPDDALIIKTNNITPMPDYEQMDTPKISMELERYGVKNLKRQRGVQVLKHIYDSTHPLLGGDELEMENVSYGDGKVVKRRKTGKSRKNLESKCYNSNKNQSQDARGLNNLSKRQSTSEYVEIVGDLLRENDPSDLIFEQKQSKKISSCRVPLHIAWHNLVASQPQLRESILLYEPLQLEVLYSLLKEQGYRYNIQDLLTFLDKKCITIRTYQNRTRKRTQKINVAEAAGC